jgi:hypothetical protein
MGRGEGTVERQNRVTEGANLTATYFARSGNVAFDFQ